MKGTEESGEVEVSRGLLTSFRGIAAMLLAAAALFATWSYATYGNIRSGWFRLGWCRRDRNSGYPPDNPKPKC